MTATPTPGTGSGTPLGFFLQQEEPGAASRLLDAQPKQSNLPFMKPEDAQYFDKLLADVDEDSLPPEEQKERKIMKLLLKIKVRLFNFINLFIYIVYLCILFYYF